MSFTRRICSRKSCKSLKVDWTSYETLFKRKNPPIRHNNHDSFTFQQYKKQNKINNKQKQKKNLRKLACAVIEYTRTKPWPFFMYKSRMAVNCSVPAVSRISSMHCWPSTSTYSNECVPKRGCVLVFGMSPQSWDRISQRRCPAQIAPSAKKGQRYAAEANANQGGLANTTRSENNKFVLTHS